jgi:hypothetical protein
MYVFVYVYMRGCVYVRLYIHGVQFTKLMPVNNVMRECRYTSAITVNTGFYYGGAAFHSASSVVPGWVGTVLSCGGAVYKVLTAYAVNVIVSAGGAYRVHRKPVLRQHRCIRRAFMRRVLGGGCMEHLRDCGVAHRGVLQPLQSRGRTRLSFPPQLVLPRSLPHVPVRGPVLRVRITQYAHRSGTRSCACA